MNAYITTENNFLAHAVRRKFQNCISWKLAFNLALHSHGFESDILDHWSASIFGKWSPTNIKAVAGYFWGLYKAYEEIGDRGRSVTMKRLSNKLYTIENACCDFSFLNLAVMDGVSHKLLIEVVDFYVSAKKNEHTPRTQNLIQQGAQQYAMNVVLPSWETQSFSSFFDII